ncbi:MAG TPA: LemA family protein [Pirellulales bacterium]|nr:LemA family protein [Pirellulales bacterium]
MKVLGGILAVLLVLALVVGSAVYQGYNHAIGLDEEVKQRWAQVENQLQRRYELIPNLVNTVKGVAGQEQKVFLGVAEARKAYFQTQEHGTIAEKAQAAGDVERTLSRLLMLQETYPELKSNESFLKLQDALEGTENRLSVERKRYNEAVQTLNTYVRRFPGTFFAGLAGVHSAEYFKIEAEAKEAPKVDFSELNEKT